MFTCLNLILFKVNEIAFLSRSILKTSILSQTEKNKVIGCDSYLLPFTLSVLYSNLLKNSIIGGDELPPGLNGCRDKVECGQLVESK